MNMVDLATLFDTVPDGLIVVDASGIVLMANRRAYALFGYEPPELVGLSVDALVPDEVRSKHAGHRTGYMTKPRERGMGDAHMDLMGQARNGRRFPIEIALNPFPGGEGHQILASIRDVSQTRMAQRLVRKAHHDAALLKIGHRILTTGSFEAVLQDITIELAEAVELGPIWLLQSDAAQARLSHSVGATAPPREWLSAEGAQLLDAARSGKRFHSEAGRLAGSPLPSGMRSALAFPLLKAEGSVAGVLIALSRTADVFDPDVVNLLDAASSLLSAVLQREASREALAHTQRLEAVGQLTGGVAHDFNNLLTVIGGNLQLLEVETVLDPDQVSLLRAAERAVDQGAALTRKLLSFAGRQQLRPAVVEIPHILAGLDRLMRATLGEKVQLQVSLSNPLPAAYVDPCLLDSVILNLVLNARDAIDGIGTVSIGARQEWIAPVHQRPDRAANVYIAIVVRDNGHGMSEHVLGRAFEPFFTTKGTGKGTGLGLSMVYGFAQQSGGHVHIESHVGRGTTVVLYLPVATEAQRMEAMMPRVPLPGGEEMILLVEDDDAVRGTVRATLRALGYQVVAAATAEDALECLSNVSDIALLFSDVTLGGATSGYDLGLMARQLRPDVCVVLTSGYPEVVGAHVEGSFPILPKPYHRDELARTLRREIDRRALLV